MQGVPHDLRGWVWWHVSGAERAAAAQPGHYEACLQAGSSKAAVRQVGEQRRLTSRTPARVRSDVGVLRAALYERTRARGAMHICAAVRMYCGCTE